MDTLLKGEELWNDAAYIAERVLTTSELKTYVDGMPVPPPTPKPAANAAIPASTAETNNAKLRYLLGRRLVRDNRFDEALPYLKPPYDKVLQKYVDALKGGADATRSKTERARAWFTAAWIARYDGMEIMGTEVAPDSFSTEGDFENTDMAKQRLSGFYETTEMNGDKEKKVKSPLVLKPTKQELQRLTKNKITPDVRYHYRIIAATLAIRAADLLPDETEELADVINRAGEWAMDRDSKAADRYYEMLAKRCAKTSFGKEVIAKHWFVAEDGPWSTAETETHKTMLEAFQSEAQPAKGP
jgi:hypothetical protein